MTELPLVRHVQPHHALASFGFEVSLPGRRFGHPAATVNERLLGLLGLLTLGLDLGRGGVIAVGKTIGQ